MLCALTVRRLKSGTLDDFRRAFVPTEETEMPPGWKRFYAIQNVDDPSQVITFGLFDGTLEELRGGQRDSDYDERRRAADEFVESVGADGIFEVLDERSLD